MPLTGLRLILLFALLPLDEHTPTFDVSSVKRAGPSTVRHRISGGPGTASPGQLTCQAVTLKQLVCRAYNIQQYQFAGPAWMNNDEFDIVAKIPAGATKTDLNLMIRDLLATRFGLVSHTESRQMAVFEMVEAKGGVRLRSPAAPAHEEVGDEGAARPQFTRDEKGDPELKAGVPMMMSFRGNGGMRISARMQPILNLFSMLYFQLDRPVIDRIGLPGLYDFNLDYSPENSRNPELYTAPPLLTAIEKQLGLKLIPKTAPVDVLVIDQVNRVPTEN